jgi:hypothetical protein
MQSMDHVELPQGCFERRVVLPLGLATSALVRVNS